MTGFPNVKTESPEFSKYFCDYISAMSNIRKFITGTIPAQEKQFLMNDENIPKILDAIIKSPEANSIARSIGMIMSSSTFLSEIFANSEAFGQYILGFIRDFNQDERNQNERKISIKSMQNADKLIKLTLKYVARTENYNAPIVLYCEQCIEEILKGLNYVNMNFLFTILCSEIPRLTITNNNLDGIMFKQGKLDASMLNFIFELYLISKYISFDINNWIHLHFYSLLAYALSSKASPTQALRIFDICSKEIANHKSDNVLLQMIIENFDVLNSFVKRQVVKQFKIIPANFVEMLKSTDVPYPLKSTLVDVIVNSSKNYKSKLSQAAAASLQQYDISDLNRTSLNKLICM